MPKRWTQPQSIVSLLEKPTLKRLRQREKVLNSRLQRTLQLMAWSLHSAPL